MQSHIATFFHNYLIAFSALMKDARNMSNYISVNTKQRFSLITSTHEVSTYVGYHPKIFDRTGVTAPNTENNTSK